MVAARLFSDAELQLLGTPLSVRVDDVAASGDTSSIPEIVELMDRECIATYGDKWSAMLQTVLTERGGRDAHDAAVAFAADATFRPFVRRFAGLSLRDHVDLLVQRLRSSGSTFAIEQSDDSIRFVLDPWGPSRLSRPPAAWQGSQPSLGAGHRKLYPCFGLPGSEGLLAIEVLFLETMATEELGRPIAVVGHPAGEGGPATLDVPRGPGDERFSDEQLRLWESPLSVQVETAAAAGDWARLAAIAGGMDAELVRAKDPMTLFRTALLSWIAREWGEPAVAETFARAAPFVMAGWFAMIDGLTPRQSIESWAMVFRSHGSMFAASEDEDAVVFKGTLGACGRMIKPAGSPEPERVGRQVRYPNFGAYDPPHALHVLQEPAAMTHGKATHPIYSAHCHVFHEQYPAEVLGRPLFLEFHPEGPDGDVLHVHAKSPGSFPRPYLERAGLAG